MPSEKGKECLVVCKDGLVIRPSEKAFRRPLGYALCGSLLREHARHGVDHGLGLRVDFDIDDVAGFACAKQGALEGFGNQVHIEFVRAHFADGEAATIQTDKAFGEDIGFERFGQGKPKRAVVCAFIDAGDGGGGSGD